MMVTAFPYPGLRPFREDEADIFCGREQQTDRLLQKLRESRFLAVVGPSGCGKSSLVRAGMISALKTGLMSPAGVRWRTAITRPGSHPIKRLAEALIGESALGPEQDGDLEGPASLDAILSRGPLGLIEILRQTPMPPNTNLLILVDQFEELFRFRAGDNRDEQDAFVALLLETSSQQEFPVSIVITMRSDYLGDCALFPGLPEALNATQYLTPRMTREQREAAIVGPARIFGGDVEPALVNRLLNESGPDANPLPLLQHVLMRMWSCTTSKGQCLRSNDFSEDVPIENLGHMLTLEDYQRVGGLADALSMHIEKAFSSLDEEWQRIAEVLFRSLCERNAGRRDDRCPTCVREVAARARIEPNQLIEIVELFRKPGDDFLAPPVPEPIRETTVLDIIHESLISRWERLDKWVDSESESAREYGFLQETAGRWKVGEAALWGTPNLELALAWRATENPTPEWAERYGGKFDLAMEFLDASEEEQHQQQARAAAEMLHKIRRARRLAAFFAMIAVVLIGVILLHRYLKVWDYVTYHSAFIRDIGEPKEEGMGEPKGVGHLKVWDYLTHLSAFIRDIWEPKGKGMGEPKGVGQLTEEQVRHRPVSFKLVQKGRWGHVRRVEAINSRREPTTRHGIDTYLALAGMDTLKEVAWEFNYGRSGRVAYETALDSDGKWVWGFMHSPPHAGRGKGREGKERRTGYYVDPEGYPLRGSSGSDSFVELEFRKTARGFDEYRRYRNRGGQAIRGPDKAFGQVRHYDAEGRLAELTSLGPDDQLMNDEFGNAILRITKTDQFGNELEAVAMDPSGNHTITTEGWSIRRTTADSYGNRVEQSYFDQDGQPALHVNGYHKLAWKRDDKGNIAEERYLDIAGQPTVGNKGCFSLLFHYDEDHNPTEEHCLGPGGELAANKEGLAVYRTTFNAQEKPTESTYLGVDERPVESLDGHSRVTYAYDVDGRLIEEAYFGTNGAPVSTKKGYSRLKIEYDKHGHPIRQIYLGKDGRPVASDKGYAGLHREYDPYGNKVRVRYFGSDIGSAVSVDGYAGWSSTYDASGNEIEILYMNPSNEPMLGKDGYAGWRSVYDNAGNEIRSTYIGTRGEPSLSSDGVARYISNYNALGQVVGQWYFGLDAKPVMHRDGYAGWVTSHDACGNLIDIWYFNVDGNPALVPWAGSSDQQSTGYSRIASKYGQRSKIEEETYYGIFGEPVLHKDGWTRIVYKYDNHGNNEKISYLGRYEEPVMISQGYHSVEFRYDDRRNPVEMAFFDVDGRPVANKDGYARLVKGYDRFGRQIEETLFDEKGGPAAMAGEGFHKAKRSYDERGLHIQEAYFGPEGPFHQDGYQVVRYKYDDRGNRIECSYLDQKENPAVNRAKGYATLKSDYDQQGRLLEQAYFDVHGNSVLSRDGYAKTKTIYSERGEPTERYWYDTDGGLTMNQSGYAGTQLKYNPQGKLIYQVYLNSDGTPVLIPRTATADEWGYASCSVNYDHYGNPAEIAYFNIDNTPIMTGNHYYRLVQSFNSRRQPLEKATFDTEGHPVMSRLGFARLLNEYDERGNLTEVQAFDEHGRPSETKYGYARMNKKYDKHGNMLEVAYFGVDRRPKSLDSGCARHTYEYDANGNQVEERCFNAREVLDGSLHGYARAVRRFNSRRQVVEEGYFGPGGQPARLRGDGPHIIQYDYDSLGNTVAATYLGIDQEPVAWITPDGDRCHRWTAVYDSAKNRIDSTCHRAP